MKRIDAFLSVQGNGLISPRRYREKGSIFGQKIENSWFSPKNTALISQHHNFAFAFREAKLCRISRHSF
jgi:hypothetical protein